MILKLSMKHQAMELYKVCINHDPGMKHQGMEVYKIYINHDPGMTLTYSTERSTSVAHALEWGNLLKCHLKGKTCSKFANGLNFHDLKRH